MYQQGIANSKVVVVKFTNEDSKYDTGFLHWMSTIKEEQVQEIISSCKEVEIMWPNAPVAEANALKRMKYIEFEKKTVIVKAYGGIYKIHNINIYRYKGVLVTTAGAASLASSR